MNSGHSREHMPPASAASAAPRLCGAQQRQQA